MVPLPNPNIDLFREQILHAAKVGTPLSIEGGGTNLGMVIPIALQS